MKETLVILAAGMGSRYGGLKQMDSVGSNGESIIDFTIYDAIRAGFKKLVLIIRKEHEIAFEENLVKKLRPFIEVEYAFKKDTKGERHGSVAERILLVLSLQLQGQRLPQHHLLFHVGAEASGNDGLQG